MSRVLARGIAPLVMIALIATACGSTPSPAPSGPGAGLRLITAGKLTIGYASNPDSIECKDGKCTGRLAYLIEKAAKGMGLEPVFEQYAFAALVPAVQSHRIDVLVAGFSVTQARAQVLYQGPPQYMGLETLIVKKGTKVASWEQAKADGLTLATVKGYAQLANWEALGIPSHAWDNTDACVEDVLQGGAAGCGVGSLYYGLQTIRNPTGRVVQELEQIEIRGPRVQADLSSSFTVARDRPELARALAQQVRTLWRDGSAQEGWAVMGLKPEDYQIYLEIPETSYYIPGPWEDGVVPPASETFPTIQPVSSGNLTVGILGDTDMLRLEGDKAVGPEAEVLNYVAGKLGLKLKVIKVTDERGSLGTTVDLLAGQLATTRDRTRQYWLTQPVAFSPDYLYLAPDATSGALPAYTSWGDLTAAGGKIGVVTGSPRIADITASGASIQEFPDAGAAFTALAGGQVQGVVATTVEYAKAVSANVAAQVVGYVRNKNLYTSGAAYAWGVKAGNNALIDAVDQGITMAWQQKVMVTAFGAAWPGADVTALQAPGPSAIGTSFGASKDYRAEGMLISGPWLQYTGYVQ